MRKLPAALSGLIVLVALAQGVAFASSSLSGSFEFQVGLDIPAGGFTLQTSSNVTFVEFEVVYEVGGVTFSNLTSYDATGMALLQFAARGSLDLLWFDSRLTFSPVLGGPGSTLDLSDSWNNPVHAYDFGRIFFVDQIEVTSLTLEDNVNTKWRVRVSKDASAGSWIWVSSEATGNGSIPVVIPIGRYIRHVEIVGITGYIDDSAISAQISSEAFVTTIDMDMFGVSIGGVFAFASGGSDVTFILDSVDSESVFDRATVNFNLDPVTCQIDDFAFDIEFELSFACFEEIGVDVGFDFDEGFTELEIDSRGISTGLSWLSADLGIDFSLTAKDLDVSLSLEIGELTCVTPYVAIDFGTEQWQIDGLTFYGIRIRYVFNGVTFESLSYLDDIHHTKEDYWEMIRISVDGDACCGGGFDVDIRTHFASTHTTIFDWAETSLDLEYDIGSNVTFGGYVEIIPTGVNDLRFSVEVTW